MKSQKHTSNLFQQRITLMLAMLLCLFVSSLEYLPETKSLKVENQQNPVSDDQNQTFLDVAVDAVVPFVVSVSHIALYFVSKIFHFEGRIFSPETFSFFYSNQLIEILFKQIISTKGP
ncbi:MAG: hypothetical protein PSV36_13830 [Algoriphagus sp.]|nr:hypothetical protein [Algoriphagus sp.]